jgi:hypothetical protein
MARRDPRPEPGYWFNSPSRAHEGGGRMRYPPPLPPLSPDLAAVCARLIARPRPGDLKHPDLEPLPDEVSVRGMLQVLRALEAGRLPYHRDHIIFSRAREARA